MMESLPNSINAAALALSCTSLGPSMSLSEFRLEEKAYIVTRCGRGLGVAIVGAIVEAAAKTVSSSIS